MLQTEILSDHIRPAFFGSRHGSISTQNQVKLPSPHGSGVSMARWATSPVGLPPDPQSPFTTFFGFFVQPGCAMTRIEDLFGDGWLVGFGLAKLLTLQPVECCKGRTSDQLSISSRTRGRSLDHGRLIQLREVRGTRCRWTGQKPRLWH